MDSKAKLSGQALLFASSLLIFGFQMIFVRASHLFFIEIDVQSIIPWTFYGFLLGCLLAHERWDAPIRKLGGGVAVASLVLLAYAFSCLYVISSITAVIAMVTANAAIAHTLVNFSQKLDAHTFYATDFLGGIAGCLLAFFLPSIGSLEATFVLLIAVGLLISPLATECSKRVSLSLQLLGALLSLGSIVLFVNPSIDLTRYGASYQRPDDPSLNPHRHGQIKWRAGDAKRVFSQWSSSGKMEVYERINSSAPNGTLDFHLNNVNIFNIFPTPSLSAPQAGGKSALIIGSGGGMEARFLLSQGYSAVTAVEINEVIYDVTKNQFAAQGGNVFQHVNYVRAEGRNYLESFGGKYDFICINHVGMAGGLIGSSDDLSENYLFTLDSLRSYYQHLNPGGVLVIGLIYSGNPDPNPLLLRTTESAAAVLKENGENPQYNIWLIGEKRKAESKPARHFRGLVVMRKGAAGANESSFVNILRPGFDFQYSYLIHSPGGANANETPEGGLNTQEKYAIAALSASQAEIVGKKYGMAAFPVSDNRPYFFQFDATHPFPLKPYTILFWLTIATILVFAWRIRARIPGSDARNQWTVLAVVSLLGFAYGILEILFLNAFSLAFSSITWVFLLMVFGLLLGSAAAGLFGRRLGRREIRYFLAGSTLILVASAALLSQKELLFFSPYEWLRSLSILALTFAASFGISLSYPYWLQIGKERNSSLPAAIFGLNSAFFILGSVVCRSMSLAWGLKETFIFLALLYGSLAYIFPILRGGKESP